MGLLRQGRDQTAALSKRRGNRWILVLLQGQVTSLPCLSRTLHTPADGIQPVPQLLALPSKVSSSFYIDMTDWSIAKKLILSECALVAE